LKYHKD